MVQKSWLHEGESAGQHLYVLAGRQSLAFFTKEAPGLAVASWESFVWQGQPAYLDCLQEATAQSNLCNHQYQHTTLIWQDAPATLLPASLEQESARQAGDAMLGPSALGELEKAAKPPYQLWYRQPADAATALWQTLPLNQAIHLWAQLPHRTDGLQVDIVDKVATLSAVVKGQLRLLVQHRFQTPEDLLYHVLHTLLTLALPLAETPVLISGLVAVDSSLYATLHQYIPLLQPHLAAVATADLPAHFFTLYNRF